MIIKIKTILLLFVMTLLSIPLAQALPEESSETAMSSCRLLGEVVASSGYGKNPRWQPIAKGYAERKADDLGATHIVFTSIRSKGSFNGVATANAYTCPQSASSPGGVRIYSAARTIN